MILWRSSAWKLTAVQRLIRQSPVRLKIFNLINVICYDCTNKTVLVPCCAVFCLPQVLPGLVPWWPGPGLAWPDTLPFIFVSQCVVCGLRLQIIQYNSSGGALEWYNRVKFIIFLTNHFYNYYRYQRALPSRQGEMGPPLLPSVATGFIDVNKAAGNIIANILGELLVKDRDEEKLEPYPYQYPYQNP